MIKVYRSPPRRADRWWSAPARFRANALSALRNSPRSRRHAGSWLAQSPVGIRSPLDAAS
jgi:hypothetical protein